MTHTHALAKRRTRKACGVLLAHFVIGCGTVMPTPPPRPGPLRVPAELEGAPIWSTIHRVGDTISDEREENRDRQLGFGPYEAVVERHEFRRAGNWLASGLRGRWDRRHNYAFELTRNSERVLNARCESRYLEQGGLVVGGSAQLGGSERTSLNCGFAAPGDTSVVWVLEVEASAPMWERNGTLRRSTEPSAGCCVIRGDRIEYDGRAVAAVSRPWPGVGTVVIGQSLPPDIRDPLAASITALLFQRPLYIPPDTT